jgi:hypothetical protein
VSTCNQFLLAELEGGKLINNDNNNMGLAVETTQNLGLYEASMIDCRIN